MPKTKTLDSVLADGDRFAQVWSENPTFSMGELTLENFRAKIAELRAVKQARDETRVKLSKLIDDTSDLMKLLDGLNARGRSGMKAVFGPDSAQYAQVGGTRLSERKTRAPKKTKPSQS